VDEFPSSLPPIRSINHHIDLIPGASMPNKAVYRLTPQQNEEVKRNLESMRNTNCVEFEEGWRMENVYRIKGHKQDHH
jgi:DNA-binding PadR family transcriptional regulator